MQKIGPCEFSELPQRYRDRFESGNIHSVAGQFLPYKPSSVALPVAASASIIYILPALGLIFTLPYYFYKDTTLLSRIINEMTSGVIQFLVPLVIFGVIAWGVYFMLSVGLRSVTNATFWIKNKRAKADGKHHYGLLLDDPNLVLRQGEHLTDYTCAFVPKSAIQECFADNIWIKGVKRRIKIDVVKVRYVDEQKYPQELVLREDFSMSARDMSDQIQQWL